MREARSCVDRKGDEPVRRGLSHRTGSGLCGGYNLALVLWFSFLLAHQSPLSTGGMAFGVFASCAISSSVALLRSQE